MGKLLAKNLLKLVLWPLLSKVVTSLKSPGHGWHFRRAGPMEKVCLSVHLLQVLFTIFVQNPLFFLFLLVLTQVYFEPEEVKACVVTCGGLCPGLNTVIREIVCGLWNQYGVRDIIGIEVSNLALR